MDRPTTADDRPTVPANANAEGDAPVGEPDATTAGATVHAGGVELERTVGLAGGLAIGVGTMVGAGIFVFPGLAAGRAGPAAAASFALGAVVALLVAVPCSELATAMPRSGGGYYFVSRILGAPFGAAVGLGLWIGLVFASAFYLVGFGQYAAGVLAEAGVAVAGSTVPAGLALVAGLVLTVVSVAGTENTAALQSLIVGALLAILTAFLLVGGLDALGVFGRRTTPEEFLPFGVQPVFTTAAFVFTAYLGFAQVATVAGDMKEPGRNLPLAMVGSVLVVAVLNVSTVLVATSAFGSARLASFGETALVEVARSYVGPVGAVVILTAGLLATVSSANASILSSSRAIYALSRDALVPRRASRVNLRYGTPHVALTMAGGPVLVLVAWGEVAVLAEVASFLHLVMYGLVCVALIVVRRRDPAWYDPAFHTPGVPWLPAVGALASFGLLLFMRPASQALGLAVTVAAAGWYYLFARDVHLRGERQ
jgi:amino acid transporter